jgi:hypothetical protein
MHKSKRVVTSWPVLIFSVVFVSVLPLLGGWIGAVFPVMSHAKILSVEPVPNGGQGSGGWVTVAMEVEKYYDCQYKALGISWVDGDGHTVRIPWQEVAEHSIDSQRSRPIGNNLITIRVGSTLDPSRWTINVWHKCHPLLPEIRTKLWPKPNAG